jgi:hypothetical protein
MLADVSGVAGQGHFAEHAAKLTGAAFHIWGEQDLLHAPDRLLVNEDAKGEAAFELGLAHLAQALEGDSLPKILEGSTFANGCPPRVAQATSGSRHSVGKISSDRRVPCE